MSVCTDIDLIAYLDGRDPDGRIGRHLAGCTHCQRAVAEYRLLIQAMGPYRRFADDGPCPKKKTVMLAALGGEAPDTAHLNRCPDCRQVCDQIARVIDGQGQPMAQLVPLPRDLADLVAGQKQRWQAQQMDKVLDFQGIKDQQAKDLWNQHRVGLKADSLPKAAFPDDLAHEDDDPSDAL